MKIKKIMGLMLFGALGLTSCNLEPDEKDNYQVTDFTACNLVIPNDGDAFATRGNVYRLTFYPTIGNVTVQGNNINLGYTNVDFLTSEMPYVQNQMLNEDMTITDIVKFQGGIYNLNGVTVTDLKGFYSTIVNIITKDDTQIEGLPTKFYLPLIMQYTVNNNYRIKTFMPDQVYTGTTTLYTESTGTNFTNDEGKYRIVFSNDLKKADVIFYNAKFAERMPSITFVLRDLDVVYNKAGFAVQIPEGETIIPLWAEGNSLTPFPSYKFTSFLLSNSSDNLATAAINYTVEGMGDRYRGMFTGVYVSDTLKTNQQ